MQRVIPLWPEGPAPYSECSPGQAQPSLTEYPADGARAAMIVIPGGGYTHKAPHEGGPVAQLLAEDGIAAYVLDYRIMPCHAEAPLCDALRAVRVLRSLGYSRVGVMGFSAGGHLACSAATLWDEGNPGAADPVERLSARPDVFAPCYAVVSLAAFRHQGSLESLLGERANDYSLIRRFSAELHIDDRTPPAFLWHTAADEAVPVEQSLMLAQALSHAMIPYELHIFPEGRHGLGLAQSDPVVGRWPRLLCDWLHRMGF